jgi:hypothetical protein
LAIAGPSPIRQLWRLERRGYPLNLDLVLANSAAGSFLSGALLDDSENPAYVPTGNGQLAIGYAFRQRFSHRQVDDLLGRLFVALYQSSPVARMLYLRSKEPWSVLLRLPSAPPAAQRLAPAAPPASDAARVACERAAATLTRADDRSLARPSSRPALGSHAAVLGRPGAERAQSWRSRPLRGSRHTAAAGGLRRGFRAPICSCTCDANLPAAAYV